MKSLLSELTRAFFLSLISFYQKVISPLLPSHCRFYPTCSEYARICFQHLNPSKALWLTLKRLGRCHPGNPGGVDLPPIK
ncbi:MAG: membrane protein insertion efficiency factor YidD [Leptospiraceae bacterium]|nr:membrane protein insertion efficiency factor YidD [Leptospiraceae bacterium]MDW8306978.1 membrane protein insertion efficiency factor YidD [Leptospiraceae bacterium]